MYVQKRSEKHRKIKIEKIANFWLVVYPLRMAPIGLKLWEHAFQMIPDISFFDAKKQNFDTTFRRKTFFVNPPQKNSAKCLFWRTCECLDVTIRCASKIHCQTYRFQPSTTLGGGVRKAFSVFFVSFGLKNLYLLRSDIMMLWYYDIMILCYFHIIIRWYYDILILWCYDIKQLWYI